MIPTVTGLVELGMRVGAAVVLGASLGFAGVAWSNPLAWLGAVVVLIPAYLHAHRTLARQPLAPTDAVTAETTPIPVVGPTDGSMSVDAVVTRPVPIMPPSARRRTRLTRR